MSNVSPENRALIERGYIEVEQVVEIGEGEIRLSAKVNLFSMSARQRQNFLALLDVLPQVRTPRSKTKPAEEEEPA